METTLHIKPAEINNRLLRALRSLFKDAETLEIKVRVPDEGPEKIFAAESKVAYRKRLDKAKKDVEAGLGISMTMEELEEYALKRAGQNEP